MNAVTIDNSVAIASSFRTLAPVRQNLVIGQAQGYDDGKLRQMLIGDPFTEPVEGRVVDRNP